MKLSDEQALHLGNVAFCKFLNFFRKRSDLNSIFLWSLVILILLEQIALKI